MCVVTVRDDVELQQSHSPFGVAVDRDKLVTHRLSRTESSRTIANLVAVTSRSFLFAALAFDSNSSDLPPRCTNHIHSQNCPTTLLHLSGIRGLQASTLFDYFSSIPETPECH